MIKTLGGYSSILSFDANKKGDASGRPYIYIHNFANSFSDR
jgi:hypothetical protein